MAYLHPPSAVATLAVVAVILGAVTALMLSSGPRAEAADVPGAESFEGVCELSGAIQHDPPLTAGEPVPTTARGSFSGTCSGELRDRDGHTRQLDDAPVGYRARGAGELSCLGGTATGRGRLLFGGNQEIEFSLTERRAPGLAVVTLEGAAGGSATVIGTVRASDLLDANERCSGSGLRRVRGDARITSLGISG